MLPSARLVAQSLRRRTSTLAFRGSYEERTVQELAHNLSDQIASHSDACARIADALDVVGRRKLLQALAAAESHAKQQGESSDRLFSAYDQSAPHEFLDRREFQAALLADRAARVSKEATQSSDAAHPSSIAIAVASSIPFVGMGAVDNSIMLVAGSEIDALFGAKLGLSTLAAAGLGNMVSDVAGVSMANRIESLTRKSKWIDAAAFKAGSRTPRGRALGRWLNLPHLTAALASSIAAKFTGAVVGVAVGCLIGMAPLLVMDTHEHSDHPS